MSTASLFPETPDQTAERLDAEILQLICGGGGRFGLPLTDVERQVLAAIRFHRGLDRAVSLRAIAEQHRLDARQIKQSVRTLRLNYRLPIGSSKNAGGGGYYLMLTDDDRRVWRNDVIDQVRAQLDVLRAADSRHAALEALGQLRVELEQEADRAQ
jgi:hypothetical protein